MARRARSLQVLYDDLNARWPGRDRASDGWIGDANHSSKSDHTPRDGIVHAIDVDEDNRAGDQSVGRALWAWLLNVRPSWCKYAIYEGRIVSSYPARGVAAWTPRPYSGSNAHTRHVHISCIDDRPYSGPRITRSSANPPPPKEDPMAVSSWAKDAWGKAKTLGVVKDSTAPRDTVSKEELMVLLDRAGVFDGTSGGVDEASVAARIERSVRESLRKAF